MPTSARIARLAPARLTRLRRGILACALLLVGFSAEGLHGLLEPHRFCAAHGALEHVGDEDEHAHAGVPAPAGVHDRDHAPEPGPGYTAGQDESDHERCGIATFSREKALLLPAGHTQVAADLPRPSPNPMREEPRAPRIPSYRLAPKQSPPPA